MAELPATLEEMESQSVPILEDLAVDWATGTVNEGQRCGTQSQTYHFQYN